MINRILPLCATLVAALAVGCAAHRRDSVKLLRPDVFGPEPIVGNYKLCLPNDTAFAKCQRLVAVARNSSIDLPLECVQRANRTSCIQAVRTRGADFFVASGHDYKAARGAGLYPAIFERDVNRSVYVAVAPRDIQLVDVQTAPIVVDQEDHRAFHAGAYFNLRRGHDICLYLRAIRDSPSVRIVNSDDYAPTDDEILLCPDRSFAEPAEYRSCNFEADLQRAIFLPRRSSPQKGRGILRIVQTLLERFGSQPDNSEDFNFFSSFQGSDDVIFRNEAVGFDFHPSYLNGVSEAVFNLLHCNTDDQDHNPGQLE